MDLKKKIEKDTDCEKQMISVIPNTLVETRERFSNSGVEVVVPTISGTVNYTVLTEIVMRSEKRYYNCNGCNSFQSHLF